MMSVSVWSSLLLRTCRVGNGIDLFSGNSSTKLRITEKRGEGVITWLPGYQACESVTPGYQACESVSPSYQACESMSPSYQTCAQEERECFEGAGQQIPIFVIEWKHTAGV